MTLAIQDKNGNIVNWFDVEMKKHAKMLMKWVNAEYLLNDFKSDYTLISTVDNMTPNTTFIDTYNRLKKEWGLPVRVSLAECHEGLEMWGQVMTINKYNWLATCGEIELRTVGDRLVFHALAATLNNLFNGKYIFNEIYKD